MISPRGRATSLVQSQVEDRNLEFTHEIHAREIPGAVTLSGKDNDDAKQYQEKQVKRAIEEVRE
jgi:hypothetical protein